MPLHIVLGFDGPYHSAAPELVYLGREGRQAEIARKASPHARFLTVRDPLGHRRANPSPGKVDVAALRSLMPAEDQKAIDRYEADLAAAYERGRKSGLAQAAAEAAVASAPAADKQLPSTEPESPAPSVAEPSQSRPSPARPAKGVESEGAGRSNASK